MWNASGIVHQTGYITRSDSVRATSRLKLPIEEGEKRESFSRLCLTLSLHAMTVCHLVCGDAAWNDMTTLKMPLWYLKTTENGTTFFLIQPFLTIFMIAHICCVPSIVISWDESQYLHKILDYFWWIINLTWLKYTLEPNLKMNYLQWIHQLHTPEIISLSQCLPHV